MAKSHTVRTSLRTRPLLSSNLLRSCPGCSYGTVHFQLHSSVVFGVHRGSFLDRLRFKRKACTRFGFLVPCQNQKVEILRPSAIRGLYVPLPARWSRFKVSRDCFAEMPPWQLHIGSRLPADPSSGYWTLLLAE